MSEKNDKCVRYYLEPLKIDVHDLTKESKKWSNNSNLNFYNDENLNSLIQQIEDIKDKISLQSETNYIKNINLSSKGLDLSINLCEYCISQKYDTLGFVKKQTKYFFDYFSEQLEHWTIYSNYKEAMLLEQSGYLEKSLNAYMDILQYHSPTGSAYYTSPFYLAIKILNYSDAIKIYKYLQQNIVKTQSSNLMQIENEFSNLLDKITSTENLYPSIKLKLINIIKAEPGILQTDIYKKLPMSYKECLGFIIYYLDKTNHIKREKQGRSYKVYMN